MPKSVKKSGKSTVAKVESSQAIKKTQKRSTQKKQESSHAQSDNSEWMNLKYHAGFGNHFESEAREGALPKG